MQKITTLFVFTLAILLTGHAQSQGVYYEKSELWLGLIKEKRNLSDENTKINKLGNWLMTGLYTFDRRLAPCKLKNDKCWEKDLNIEHVRTSKYDGKKVYIISLKMDDAKQKFTEGSPFGASSYESEFVIDANDYAILRQSSVIYPEENLADRSTRFISLKVKKFSVERNYKSWKGKYYLASLNTICTFETQYRDTGEESFNSELEHELITTRLLRGPEYAKPQIDNPDFYPLGDFESAPFNQAFWDEWDAKRDSR